MTIARDMSQELQKEEERWAQEDKENSFQFGLSSKVILVCWGPHPALESHPPFLLRAGGFLPGHSAPQEMAPHQTHEGGFPPLSSPGLTLGSSVHWPG